MTQQNSGGRRQAQRPRPQRRTPVMGYLLILFAVAFLLLLFAYFQQQRANSEAADDAQQKSASALQSIQNLMNDNELLGNQNQELQDQVAELEEQNQTLQSQAQASGDQAVQLGKAVEAMQWFWQINEAYARGRYTTTRNLIEQFEPLGLREALPTENTTGTDRFSPANRYAEIYNALY
ncbi:MAG: hypothetical protein HFF05_03295 [Oscillospiraceae bacterium]|nr:hypothetical protein [Oscillospiraceae bacterium]